MPKENEEKKIRSIEEIQKDPALTEEDWRKELTEAYKAKLLEDPQIRDLQKNTESMREMVTIGASNKELSPTVLKNMVEELEKATEKENKALQEIDKTVAKLVDEDREKHGVFAPAKNESKIGEPKAKEPKAEEPKPEEPKQEQPQTEEVFDRAKMLEEAHKEANALRQDLDMPDAEWMEKMHKALEKETILQEDGYDFDAQDKKTKELMEKIQKLNKDLKEGDDRKPLEDLEKELGEHLQQTAKDRSLLASRVERGYSDELRKRKEAKEDAYKKMDKQSPEAKAKKEEAERLDQESAKANDYADLMFNESETPKENIFQSAFMKAFSGWLPQTIFGALGAAFGGQGLRAVQVPMDSPIPKFFDMPDALKPTGAENFLGIFKRAEEVKEKGSEEILKTDKNAELNFDQVDQAAMQSVQNLGEIQQAQSPKKDAKGLQINHGAAFKVKEGQFIPVENLKNVPHAEVKPEEAKKGLQIDHGPAFKVKEGQFIPVETLKNVPHAEVQQPEAVQQDPVPEKKEPEKKEPEKQPEAQAGERELTNVEKAFKIAKLFEALTSHDSKTHINSGKFDSMKKAMGNVHSMLGESFGDSFGSLMRDFGHLKSFQDLCKKGGPLDLAVGQALEEVEKKCEGYVKEKTENLTKTHMGSGLGNARIKDAMDALSIVNPNKANELGKHISIDIKDGKVTKRLNYNELNELERKAEQKEMDEKKLERKEIVGAKKKEKELLDRDPVMSKEEKSKQQGLRLK